MTDTDLQDKIDAAAFRRMLHYLQDHPRLNNVDLLTAANFCRDRLSVCYQAAAKDNGVSLSLDAAKLVIYGMPHKEWIRVNYTSIQQPEELLDAYAQEGNRDKRLTMKP